MGAGEALVSPDIWLADTTTTQWNLNLTIISWSGTLFICLFHDCSKSFEVDLRINRQRGMKSAPSFESAATRTSANEELASTNHALARLQPTVGAAAPQTARRRFISHKTPHVYSAAKQRQLKGRSESFLKFIFSLDIYTSARDTQRDWCGKGAPVQRASIPTWPDSLHFSYRP